MCVLLIMVYILR